jgi:molybdopterin synthase catalytic subunit
MSVDLAGLSAEPIDAASLAGDVDPECGAVVTFEGRVRNVNEGRRVVRLQYDAYPEMAERVFEDILRRTRETHPVMAIRVLHRTGTLAVGDTAVAVVVAAGHRAEAFAAAKFVLEAVKEDLPVWKREEYEDGSSRWLGGPAARDRADAGGTDGGGAA